MIVFTRRFRPQVPLELAELLMPVAGERFAARRRVGPLLVKIWCAERKAAGLVGRWVPDRTVLSELAGFPKLLERLGATTRRDIRRATDKDGLAREDGWSVDQIIDFHRDHDPTNPNRPDRGELQRLRDAGRLTISAAVVDGEALAVHASIEDFPRVRFLKGYGKRKEADNPARYSLVGRANKALHYLDMAAYHAAGYETYDWGGFTGVPDNGIDRFKLQFLGEVAGQVHFRGVLPPGGRDVAF
jgi:hypothetical protein